MFKHTFTVISILQASNLRNTKLKKLLRFKSTSIPGPIASIEVRRKATIQESLHFADALIRTQL